MGFRNGGYATVWDIRPQEKTTLIRISTSRKTKEGNYEDDFSGFVMLIGQANEMAKQLSVKDRIRLGECEVCSRYDKNAQKEYITNKCFSFEKADQKGSKGKTTPPSKNNDSSAQTRRPAFDFDEEGSGDPY